MLHRQWITLPSRWTLQDVQAALNVIIAFLCAASIFVLVRHFWVLAARKVTKQKDVPAYSLLSLNTIGETVDVIWLLRHEILTSRYRGLFIQCIFVLFLTVCTLLSGFLARFSTRSVLTIVPELVEGSIASRDTSSLLYNILDVAATYDRLNETQFPPTKLAEFWPDPTVRWRYTDDQWNSSWTMKCSYNESVEVVGTSIVTNNCTNGLWQQWPWLYDNWWDWGLDNDSTAYYHGYRSSGMLVPDQVKSNTTIKDVLMFVHGYEMPKKVLIDNFNITKSMRIRTVAVHLEDLPRNISSVKDDEACHYVKGPIRRASYTSATCELVRDLGNLSSADLYAWGAGPDKVDAKKISDSYIQFYAGRFWRESISNTRMTTITGPELVKFYQAYQVVKETRGTLYYNTSDSKPKVIRTIDVQVRAAQVSLTCIILCGVMALVVIFGLINYWLFLLWNLKDLDKTPQSKLDWMLQTLRTETDSGSKTKARHKLRTSISSSDKWSETVPLTKLDQEAGRSKSTISSITTREVDPDEIAFASPVQLSNHSWQKRTPGSPFWSQTRSSYHPIGGQGEGDEGFSTTSRHSSIVSPTSPYQWDNARRPSKW
ncbi:hypothetical protein H2198_005708 [Neophaeococcomyces mojaviensis]|uniref:Uncharacterized protein n=1 Tax=Neophaeococcomyces mojaviensis TaxID=3383035 RepID=A0ACC3A4V8_9EURO|nr:hypothetical protein H2198_005708 [Knufia sp. JES_112]